MKKKIFAASILSVLAVVIASGTDGIQAAGKDNVIWLVKPQYSYASNFFEGVGTVQKDGKYRDINRNGEEVKTVFYEGLGRAFSEKNGKYGYVDKSGKFVIEPQFSSADRFRGGLARVSVVFVVGNLRMEKWGFINREGVFINKPEYDELKDFCEGLAAVKKYGKWGYIDKKGIEVIKPQFTMAGNFSEGLASVKIDKEWGYIDKSGKFAIEPQFGIVYDFSGGLARVREGQDIDDDWGYINKNGKFVIKPKFDSLYDFHDGLARFSIEGEGHGYVNRDGKIIIEELESADDFSGGWAFIRTKEKSGFINTKGEFIFDASDYSIDTAEISEGLAPIGKKGKWGYVDMSGNIVIEPQFEDAKGFIEGAARVQTNGKWGYIKNPVPSEKQEQWLELRGMKIGTVKSVSKSEIIVEGKDVPGKINENDVLCLFSGGTIVVLNLTSDIKSEITCEVISGNIKGIKPGTMVYKYKKIIRDQRARSMKYE